MRSLLPLFSALLISLAASPAGAQTRSCGTASPSTPEGLVAWDRTTNESGQYLQSCPPGGTIMVAFHILHSGTTGQTPSSAVLAQIAELNLNFGPSGYQFVLGSLDYTNNAAWFNLSTAASETAIKSTLAVNPATNLNIYSCIPYGYLGFAYYPWSFPESSFEHSVFIDYRTVPGGGLVPYDLGRTATHEIGHYLGLAHTFENGCVAPGDFIADTPYEASPAFGCPIGRNTCASPGLDPIQNYMDYTDDACYTEFTPDQWARMCAMTGTYRPSLIGGGPTPARNGTWGELKVRYR